jgi:Phosphatidylinositol-4-phosphate 5-Kinase/MIT (microtubule interacting and transport) domain
MYPRLHDKSYSSPSVVSSHVRESSSNECVDEALLAVLREMGFVDRQANEALLKKHRNQLHNVIDVLLDRQSKQANARENANENANSTSSKVERTEKEMSHVKKGIWFARQACCADECRNYASALPFYIRAVEHLVEALGQPLSSAMHSAVLENIERYLSRAEVLKAHIRHADNASSDDSANDSNDSTTTAAAATSRHASVDDYVGLKSDQVRYPYPCLTMDDRSTYRVYASSSSSSSSAQSIVSLPRPLSYDLNATEGMVYALLTGIRESVESLGTREPKLECTRYEARAAKTIGRGSHEFVEHAPSLFDAMRALLCGIDRTQYLKSLASELAGMKSPGKSGSELFFSSDLLYILKTVSADEFQFLHSALLDYYNYVRANPNTLLIRFFGLYTLRQRERDMHFVVMENLCPPETHVVARYDLKGSTVGRRASASERRKKTPVLKDLDFARRIEFGPARRHMFMHQLTADARFLANLNIMDYSVLLCVSQQPMSSSAAALPTLAALSARVNRLSAFKSCSGGIRSSDERDRDAAELYFVGIIDVLQEYNLRKRLETKVKSLVHPVHLISCVDAEQYRQRFVDYFSRITEPDSIGRRQHLFRQASMSTSSVANNK